MSAAPSIEPQLIDTPPPELSKDRVVQSYLAANVVSACGDTVFTIGLAWTAVHLLTPTLAGIVVGVEALPQGLLVLAGGVIADRLDTRRVMLAGTIGRIAVLTVAMVCWSGGWHSGVVLFAVAIGFGAASGLSDPAQATMIRQLVRGEDLVTVGGWAQIGSRLARLLGAPIGAAIVAAGGMTGSMAADTFSFLAVALALVLVVRPRFRLPQITREPWRVSLRTGLSYVWRTPVARTFILGLSALNVFVSPIFAIGVALRVSQSHWPPAWLGISEATFAIGAILGSIVGVRWQGYFLPRRAFGVLVVQGAGLALVGLPHRSTLIIGMLIVGVTSGLGSVWLSGSFQRVIAPSHLGRVASVSRMGDLLLIPVTTPAFAALAAGASITAAAAIFGVCMATLCLVFALRPEIRTLR